MTSLRYFVACLIGSGVILALGLLLLTLSLAWGAPFIVFALAIAGWSFGAYRRGKWAWHVAFYFCWAFAVLAVVVILAFAASMINSYRSNPEALLTVVLCVASSIIFLVGTVVGLRRSLWHLNEERAQFFPEGSP